MDVHNAFLHGILGEEVCNKLPQGYLVKPDETILVCKLHKSIYGLKHTSRTWFAKLKDVISLMGFAQCKSDYSVFLNNDKGATTIILAYVDDLLITKDNIDIIKRLKNQLRSHFAIKDLGLLKYFLGLEFSNNSNSDIYVIS